LSARDMLVASLLLSVPAQDRPEIRHLLFGSVQQGMCANGIMPNCQAARRLDMCPASEVHEICPDTCRQEGPVYVEVTAVDAERLLPESIALPLCDYCTTLLSPSCCSVSAEASAHGRRLCELTESFELSVTEPTKTKRTSLIDRRDGYKDVTQPTSTAQEVIDPLIGLVDRIGLNLQGVESDPVNGSQAYNQMRQRLTTTQWALLSDGGLQAVLARFMQHTPMASLLSATSDALYATCPGGTSLLRDLQAEADSIYLNDYAGDTEVSATFTMQDGTLQMTGPEPAGELQKLAYCMVAHAEVLHVAVHHASAMLIFASANFADRSAVWELLNMEQSHSSANQIFANVLLLQTGILHHTTGPGNRAHYRVAHLITRVALEIISQPCSRRLFSARLPEDDPRAAHFTPWLRAAQEVICDEDNMVELTPVELDEFKSRISQFARGQSNPPDLTSLPAVYPAAAALMIAFLHTMTLSWQLLVLHVGEQTWEDHAVLLGAVLPQVAFAPSSCTGRNGTYGDLSVTIASIVSRYDLTNSSPLVKLEARLNKLREEVAIKTTPEKVFASDMCLTASPLV